MLNHIARSLVAKAVNQNLVDDDHSFGLKVIKFHFHSTNINSHLGHLKTLQSTLIYNRGKQLKGNEVH